MPNNVTIDTREWRAAAQQLFTTSKRELPDFMNGQAFKVAIEAMRLTDRANRAQVERELGQVATKVRLSTSRKTGAKSFKSAGRIVEEDSLAARILGKRFKDTGSWGVRGSDMAKRVLNLIAARVRSINFIRAGWIGAIRRLDAVVRRKPRVSRSRDVKTYGVLKGGALPAADGVACAVEIFNTALSPRVKEPSKKGNPMPVAEIGLIRAFAAATADMRQEFERRMEAHFKAVSAR